MTLLKMYSLLKTGIFHCYVRLPEGNRILFLRVPGGGDSFPNLPTQCSHPKPEVWKVVMTIIPRWDGDGRVVSLRGTVVCVELNFLRVLSG